MGCCSENTEYGMFSSFSPLYKKLIAVTIIVTVIVTILGCLCGYAIITNEATNDKLDQVIETSAPCSTDQGNMEGVLLPCITELRRLGHKLDQIKTMLKERTGQSLNCKTMTECSKKKTSEEHMDYMNYYFEDQADQI